jgi:hypothetical protein
MMKKAMLALGATLTLLTPMTPAMAHGRGYDRGYERGYQEGRYETERVGRNTRVWRGDDGRYYCRRSNGTTGLIIGAAGGALLGRAVDTRGERTTGTILGAAIGALAGREIDRGRARCR